MVNLRTPLIFTTGVVTGVPDLRTPLVDIQPIAGGVPDLRASLITMQPIVGAFPHLRVALMIVQSVVQVMEPLPVATLLFPPLRGGMKWDRGKTPSYNNARRVMTSGRRSVTPFMVYPRWNFELSYEVMPDTRYLSGMNIVLDTVQSIVDLYKETQGGAQAFLYHDPDDYHVVGGTIATADGVTLQWPFMAPVMGTVIEPAGQVDLSFLFSFTAPGAISGNQIHLPGHGLTTGQYPPMFISNTGGSLPGGLAASTPYWPIVIDANHIELASSYTNAIGSTPITLSSAGTGTDTLSKGYAIYDNGTIVNPGSASLTLPNQIVFVSAPTSGHAITADFDYYFVCRFDDDKMDLSEFSNRLYELQKLNFSSEVS